MEMRRNCATCWIPLLLRNAWRGKSISTATGHQQFGNASRCVALMTPPLPYGAQCSAYHGLANRVAGGRVKARGWGTLGRGSTLVVPSGWWRLAPMALLVLNTAWRIRRDADGDLAPLHIFPICLSLLFPPPSFSSSLLSLSLSLSLPLSPSLSPFLSACAFSFLACSAPSVPLAAGKSQLARQHQTSSADFF